MKEYYTYLIGWPELDLWYYGVRTGNKVSPEEDFWHYYFTSSKYVRELRCSYGEPTVRKIRKKFSDKLKAKNWERQVLNKMKVVRNNKWLNKSVPGAWEMTDEICQKISKAISNKRWITDGHTNQYINLTDDLPDGWYYGRSGVGATKQWRKKLSEAQSKNKASTETRNKLSAMRKGKGNNFYGKQHSKESLSKMSVGHDKYWKSVAKGTYKTPWGEYWSTPKAAKGAPFEVSSSMIWHFCRKYSDKIIEQQSKFGQYSPSCVGKTYSEAGFNFEKS